MVYSYEHEFLDGRDNAFGLGNMSYEIPDGDDSKITFESGCFSDNNDAQYVNLKMKRFKDIEKELLIKEQGDRESRVKIGKLYAANLNYGRKPSLSKELEIPGTIIANGQIP